MIQYEVVRGTAHHQGVVHVPPPPPPPSPLPIRLLLHLLTPPAQRPCISSLLSVTKIVLQYEVVRGIDSHTLTHPASPPPLGRVASITYMNDVTPSHPPYYPPIRSPPPVTPPCRRDTGLRGRGRRRRRGAFLYGTHCFPFYIYKESDCDYGISIFYLIDIWEMNG